MRRQLYLSMLLSVMTVFIFGLGSLDNMAYARLSKDVNEGVKGAYIPAPPSPNTARGAATGVVVGTSLGALLVGSTLAAPLYGAGVGALVGATVGAGMYSADDEANLQMKLRADGVNIIQLGDIVQLTIPVDILFDPNEVELREEAPSILYDVVIFLKQYGPVDLYVAGHTDNVTSFAKQLSRSTLQAQSVATYLWVHGINRDRITFYGYGRTQDVATNNTVTGSAYNRRIEISFWKFPQPHKFRGVLESTYPVTGYPPVKLPDGDAA